MNQFFFFGNYDHYKCCMDITVGVVKWRSTRVVNQTVIDIVLLFGGANSFTMMMDDGEIDGQGKVTLVEDIIYIRLRWEPKDISVQETMLSSHLTRMAEDDGQYGLEGAFV